MLRTAETIVVLGCRVEPTGEPSPTLVRRLQIALRAYEEEIAPTIIASGGRWWWGRFIEAVAMRDYLSAAGVDPGALIIEPFSQSTVENACFCADLLRRQGCRRVFLSTCSWHLPRATENFRRAGIEPIAPPRGWLDAQQPPEADRVLRARERICRWIDPWRMTRVRRRRANHEGKLA